MTHEVINSDVDPTASLVGCVVENSKIGPRTKVWRWTHIMGATIGEDCMVAQGVFIADQVSIGDRVRIQNNAAIGRHATIGNDVYIGPNVVFANSRYPKTGKLEPIIISDGVCIGANVVIMGGVKIGEYAIIGAGSIVTRNVMTGEKVVGVTHRNEFYPENQTFE